MLHYDVCYGCQQTGVSLPVTLATPRPATAATSSLVVPMLMVSQPIPLPGDRLSPAQPHFLEASSSPSPAQQLLNAAETPETPHPATSSAEEHQSTSSTANVDDVNQPTTGNKAGTARTRRAVVAAAAAANDTKPAAKIRSDRKYVPANMRTPRSVLFSFSIA